MSVSDKQTFPTQLAYDDAHARVAAVASSHRLADERLAIARVHGRVLAQNLFAPIPLPPFDNSAMDGFAVRHCDLAKSGESLLELVGEQFAGRAGNFVVGQGQCLRITTGAALPADADTVVMKENTTVQGSHVRICGGVQPGVHVRRAGEDVAAGAQVLQQGMVMSATRVALAAALGFDQLCVAQRPTVAVFTTGDELVEPGMPLEPGEIYNSNRELLLGLLRADGLEPTAWPTLPDEPGRLAAMLGDACASFDVVITCGGVSAGEKDHLPALLKQWAGQGRGTVHFWKVQMKPGMPVLFGQFERAQLLCLPGNPVSVLATYLTLGRCLLDGLQGRAQSRASWHARMSAGFDKRNTRREFLRGRLLPGDDGMLRVEPNPADGSHRLAAAAQSDALIVLPEGERNFVTGDVVEILIFAQA